MSLSVINGMKLGTLKDVFVFCGVCTGFHACRLEPT